MTTECGYWFGWFSTGRDEAACELLRAAKRAVDDGFIPANIEFVFVNREYGEAPESDNFLKLVAELGIPRRTLSSRRFEPELHQQDLSQWRRRYDAQIMHKLDEYAFEADMIVLAGYMLIVSPDLCQKYPLVNLHPALPGGPVGTWQDVIDSLIQQQATESGIQIHRVIPEVDRGPALSFCRFTIPRAKNQEVLRHLIRQQQTEREIPLLLLTMRAIANGETRVYKDRIVNLEGKQVQPIDFTDNVEAMLRKSQV